MKAIVWVAVKASLFSILMIGLFFAWLRCIALAPPLIDHHTDNILLRIFLGFGAGGGLTFLLAVACTLCYKMIWRSGAK